MNRIVGQLRRYSQWPRAEAVQSSQGNLEQRVAMMEKQLVEQKKSWSSTENMAIYGLLLTGINTVALWTHLDKTRGHH